MIYTLPPAWPKLQVLSRKLIFFGCSNFPRLQRYHFRQECGGIKRSLSHPFTFQLGFLRGNDTVTALAPSFLSGGEEHTSICLLHLCPSLCPTGTSLPAELLLGSESQGKQAASQRESSGPCTWGLRGRKGKLCSGAVEICSVSGTRSQHPCLCQISHLARVKGFGTVVVIQF